MNNRGILIAVIIGILIATPILWVLNSRAEAAKKAEQAIVDSRPENLIKAAEAMAVAGDYDSAMIKINEAIRKEPGNLVCLAYRIKIEVKQADELNMSAQEHYRSAAARIDVAITMIDDALKNGFADKWDILPHFHGILISKAQILDKCGNPKQAQAMRRQAAYISTMITKEQQRRTAEAQAKIAAENAAKQKNKIPPQK